MNTPARHRACLMVITFAMISVAWTPWGAIYESARDERSVADQAMDKQISLSIKGTLADKDAGLALKVHVYCFLRHVYLVGAINDVDFRKFAVKTARMTSDVRQVTEHFVWESDTTASDLEIATRIRTELIAEGDLSATQIEMEVMNGEVVMLGMVRSRADAMLAEKIARGVKGVKKVTSFLILPK